MSVFAQVWAPFDFALFERQLTRLCSAIFSEWSEACYSSFLFFLVACALDFESAGWSLEHFRSAAAEVGVGVASAKHQVCAAHHVEEMCNFLAPK